MAARGQQCRNQYLRQVYGLENSGSFSAAPAYQRWKIRVHNILPVTSSGSNVDVSNQNPTTVGSQEPHIHPSGPHSVSPGLDITHLQCIPWFLPNSYQFTVLPKNFSIFTGKKIFVELFGELMPSNNGLNTSALA